MTILSIQEFIALTRNEPNKWINYCEILLDRIGRVILCEGSHSTTALKYASLIENKDINDIRDEIYKDFCSPLEWVVDKHNVIAIWHNGYTHNGKMNRLQKRSISLLQNENLMWKDYELFIRETHEYKNYLKRKEMFKS